MKVKAEIEFPGEVVAIHPDAEPPEEGVAFMWSAEKPPHKLFVDGVEVGQMADYPRASGEHLFTDAEEPAGFITRTTTITVTLELPTPQLDRKDDDGS